MKLSEWLEVNGLTQTEFAKRTELPVSTVNRIVNGTRRPSGEVIARIERATGGAVTASSFFPEAA